MRARDGFPTSENEAPQHAAIPQSRVDAAPALKNRSKRQTIRTVLPMETVWIVVVAVAALIATILFFFLVLRQYRLSTSHQAKILDFMER